MRRFLTMSRLQRPIHLVLDFDCTLTKHDSLHLLREIPLRRNARLGHYAIPVPEWSALERAYMEDYNRHQEATAATKRELARITSASAARSAYSQYLASRRVVELQSLQRAEAWGLFKGVTIDDVRGAAQAVIADGRLSMREGWQQLLCSVRSASQSKASIISVNWSASFIRECLLADLKQHGQDREDLSTMIERDLEIHANDIDGLHEPHGSSGRMQSKVHTSADKLKYLPLSQGNNPDYPFRQADECNPYLIYVGDSSTDFDALMAADTGIWLNPAENVEDAQRDCQQSFKPLQLTFYDLARSSGHIETPQGLAWANDFESITDYVVRLATSSRGPA